MAEPKSARAIATEHGAYLVEGLDRFEIGGDLDVEVAAAVTRHHQRFGVAPSAVMWDDAVLNFRRNTLLFNLTRVFVPAGDPYLAAALDSAGRAAIRADPAPPDGVDTSAVLGTLGRPDEVAHASALVRLIGWPEAAPLAHVATPRPRQSAASISVVINYRDKARVTMACLFALRRQRIGATLEIILVDNQSLASERLAVEATCTALFGANPRVAVRHLTHDADFNHSAQCNAAAAIATGDVLVMMSNDCVLVDPDTLQTIADWALEPGMGAAGPLLLDADGLVACAGMAIGQRQSGAPDLRIHEAEVPYLAEVIRLTNGVSFACAAVARATWERIGGADAADFPIDYNDADFALRLRAAELSSLHVGTHRARHAAGMAELRARANLEQRHARLAERHGLEQLARGNPSAVPIRVYPSFKDEDALALCDYVRLYRRAREWRMSGATLPAPLAAAFEALEAVGATAGGVGGTDDYFARVDVALRAVCDAFIATAPSEQVTERFRRAIARLPEAMRTLSDRIAGKGAVFRSGGTDAIADGKPAGEIPDREASSTIVPEEAVTTIGPAWDAPSAPDPDPERAFVSHGDAGFATAPHRLLVFADTFGASPQILLLEGLATARAEGRAAVRIITEEDLLNLRSMRGAERVTGWLRETIAHLRPTAIIFSRFAAHDGYRAIRAALADFPDVPCVCHIDDDFFTLPAVIGVDRYREARHPRRIHCLGLIAAEADLIIVPTDLLGERLAAAFGAARIGICPMSEGGAPCGAPADADLVTIGYFGSATHNRDLEMIAPALRQVKADRPEVRIEIVGSVAKLSAAASLGDAVARRQGLEHDYAAFRDAMRGWGWRIGLAPLLAHPFNAAKTPVKWTEYAQAGIPVIASRTEPYLALGDRGALLLASPDEWHGRIMALLHSAPQRRALTAAATRLLGSFDGWRRTEGRLLGLLARAAARRTLARRAA